MASFREVPLDTADGLSGLAIDDTGGLWTLAERAERLYRIQLDKGLTPTIETFVVEGVPKDLDLEGVAWLGGDRFALGTEGERGVATILLAHRDRDHIVVDSTIVLPEDRLGMALPENHGAEGVCGHGETIIASIEGAGGELGHRWAPVVRIERGAIVAVYRVPLTTDTGKLSGLDCSIDDKGVARAWAIERHFEVTKVLTFDVPPGLNANPAREILPRVALDLGPTLKGRLNLEGIVRMPDGTTYAVTDNQWKTISGPSLLLVFDAPLR